MGNFWNKFKTAIWESEDLEEDEYYEDESGYDYNPEVVTDIQTLRQRRTLNANGNQNRQLNNGNPERHNIIILKPEKHEDSQDICNHIRSNKPVVVNLELLEQSIAQRVMDFLGGACYSLDCTVEQISDKIFIMAPSNYDISTNFKNELKDELFSWVSYK